MAGSDRFDSFIRHTIVEHEGERECPSDPVLTKWGVVADDLRRAIEAGIVPSGTPLLCLTVDQAAAIFRRLYWEAAHYDRIEWTPLAAKVLDLSLPMGTEKATKCLQRALRAAGAQHVADDGNLGPVTLGAANGLQGPRQEAALAAFRSECAGYFRALHGDTAEASLGGWLERAYE